jgi:hypothetical protein
MKLRNGKHIGILSDNFVYEKNKNNNKFERHYIIEKYLDLFYFIDRYKIKYKVTCICNCLFVIFNRLLKTYYSVQNSTFECDYILYKNKINDLHIKNICHLVLKFIKSDFINVLKNEMSENGENENTKYIDISCIIGISFCYFHMVIIETLYEDCLTWFSIKTVVNIIQSANQKLNKNMGVNHNNLIKYAINIYNRIVLSDTQTFSYMRRFMLKL